MKRSPLRRNTPLRQRSEKRAKRDEAYADSRFVVMGRAKGRCEAVVADGCRRYGTDAHHVQRRSQGGTDDPSNLLWLCRDCHAWVHAHPAAARDRGLLK